MNQESELYALLVSDDPEHIAALESGSAETHRFTETLLTLPAESDLRPLMNDTLNRLTEVERLFGIVVNAYTLNDIEQAKTVLADGKSTIGQFREAATRLNAGLSGAILSTWDDQSRRAAFAKEMIVFTVVVSVLAIMLHSVMFRATKQSLLLAIENERRYRRLIDSSPDAIAVHQDGVIVFANPACVPLMGVSHPSELIGQSIMKFVPAHFAEAVSRRAQHALKEKEVGAMDEQFIRPDGTIIDVEVTAIGIPYNGRPAVLLIGRDIGVRKEAERKLTEANELLSRLSQLDGLTGIPNRRSFDSQLQASWEASREQGGDASLILLDVDMFKEYNDRYGHLVGDECLQRIAHIVEDEARSAGGSAYRYGGEEFAVLLEGYGREAGRAAADRIRQAVLDAGIPHEDAGHNAVVTVSVGVATLSPGCCDTVYNWLQAADQALYQAKRCGRNSTVDAPAC